MRVTRGARTAWMVTLAALAGCSAPLPEVGAGGSVAVPVPAATPESAVVTAEDPRDSRTAHTRGGLGRFYAVGGTMTGLSGSVTLRLAGGSEVVVKADGAFAFPSYLADGEEYAVSVAVQPATQVCVVTSGGSGVVAAADVTSVAVHCAAGFAISGTVTGASGPLVLQDQEGAPLPVSGNGTFVFPARLTSGSAFDVHVAKAPTGQGCAVVAHASGTITAAVTDVSVQCFAPYATCKAMHEGVPRAPSGVYPITPEGTLFDAYCDMVRDGGGWTRAVNIRPDSNFQGDRPEAFGDVSKEVSLAKLDDALITSLSTLGYFRFECGAFSSFVRTAEATWSSARSNSLTWSIDPSRTGDFSCAASRDGYGFSSADGSGSACDLASVAFVSADGANEGGGCYQAGAGWHQIGKLWVK